MRSPTGKQKYKCKVFLPDIEGVFYKNTFPPLLIHTTANRNLPSNGKGWSFSVPESEYSSQHVQTWRGAWKEFFRVRLLLPSTHYQSAPEAVLLKHVFMNEMKYNTTKGVRDSLDWTILVTEVPAHLSPFILTCGWQIPIFATRVLSWLKFPPATGRGI